MLTVLKADFHSVEFPKGIKFYTLKCLSRVTFNSNSERLGAIFPHVSKRFPVKLDNLTERKSDPRLSTRLVLSLLSLEVEVARSAPMESQNFLIFTWD